MRPINFRCESKSRNSSLFAYFLLATSLGGCSILFPSPPPLPPETQPEPEPIESFPAWTARPDVRLGGYSIPHPFTRLQVLGRDSLGVHVRCDFCEVVTRGIIEEADIVTEALPPEVAAWDSLAEFALAIRDAAARRDLDTLRPVMVPDFSFSFVGVQSPDVALEVWRSEDFATLEHLPGLLDRGLATADGRIWSAPPAFATDLGYRGLRAGFRQRPDGRWEWLYLIRGIIP